MTQLTATILSQLKCVESPLARINYIITSKATFELFRQSSLSPSGGVTLLLAIIGTGKQDFSSD